MGGLAERLGEGGRPPRLLSLWVEAFRDAIAELERAA